MPAATPRTTNVPSTLMIPVENQVRELDAKLFLGCVAAERGYPVVLGSRAFLHYQVDRIPAGVYLAKSMRTLSERMFGILQNLGHDIVGFDEEALVRRPDEEFYKLRVSAQALNRMRMVLAWGEDDARVFREFSGNRGVPVTVTGNPRIDLMRPELTGFYDREVAQIKAQYGNFVLINSNFGGANHFLDAMSDVKQLATGQVGKDDTDYMVEWSKFRYALFGEFKRMLPALAARVPNVNLILRPHPSESHEQWRELAAPYANVQVVNEGSVFPWLMAASAMIANGCTTTIESWMLQTPSIDYAPLTDARYDEPLPQALGISCATVESLAELVLQAAAGTLAFRDDRVSRDAARQYFHALDGRFASDHMIDVLDDLGYRQAAPVPVAWRSRLLGRLHNRGRTATKRFNMGRVGHRNHISYHDHRFPAVSVPELRARIQRFAALTGRFEGVHIAQRDQHVWEMSGNHG
ncbi:MAG: surface carbohydrate biosynthesis protein [Pseudomonadales bacterium]